MVGQRVFTNSFDPNIINLYKYYIYLLFVRI